MGYSAEVIIDVTFHSHQDLTGYLTAAHIPLIDVADPDDLAWAILADLSEYATGTLDGLHLTGRGTGRLLHGYPQRVWALARHATGTITLIAEDDTRWQHQLGCGHVVTSPDGAGTPDAHPGLASRPTHTSSGSPVLKPGALR